MFILDFKLKLRLNKRGGKREGEGEGKFVSKTHFENVYIFVGFKPLKIHHSILEKNPSLAIKQKE